MTKSFKEIYISEEKSNSQNACQNKVEIWLNLCPIFQAHVKVHCSIIQSLGSCTICKLAILTLTNILNSQHLRSLPWRWMFSPIQTNFSQFLLKTSGNWSTYSKPIFHNFCWRLVEIDLPIQTNFSPFYFCQRLVKG
jgi:hypothetical protein